MLYEYECVVCGDIFEEFVSYEDRHSVLHCGKRAVKLISQINTDSDFSYKFEAHIFDKPVHVRSKGHYKELLKKNDMLDCSPKEAMDEARYKKKSIKKTDDIKTRKRAEKLYEKMKKDNVGHVAKEAMGKLIHKKPD